MGVYEYMQNYCVCPGVEVYLALRTRDGQEVNAFPVMVYNVNQQALSQADDKEEYISIWNANAANAAIGILTGLLGPFSFKLILKPGQTAPAYVIGETEASGLDLLIDSNGDALIDSDGVYLLFQ